MNRKRSLIRAGAVLGVALAAGHLVQKTMMEPRATAEAPRPENITPVAADATVPVNPLLPAGAALGQDTVVPAPASEVAAKPEVVAPVAPPPAPVTAALTPEIPAVPKPAPVVTPAPVVEAVSCAPSLSLAAAPQAMIEVTVTAACDAGARVVLRHAGLTVAETLDDQGKLLIDLPALEATGEVSVLFPTADILQDAVAVPGVDKLRRFAVQWMAADAFQLHAMENGAAYGQPGDVNAQNPVSPSGGYLVSLGNPALDLPMMASVYTWPPGVTSRPVIEAAVTDLTCGREILGQTLLSDKGGVTITDLTLAMPECDALGDILVLNNLVPETTLAAAN